MKKENIPALVMALGAVAVLVIVMCDVGIRFVTKNIIYDKMHVDSPAVLWIVDGLLPEQEGTAAVIDWNALYPRETLSAESGSLVQSEETQHARSSAPGGAVQEPDADTGSGMQPDEGGSRQAEAQEGMSGIGALTDVWGGFNGSMRGAVLRVEGVIDYYCTDGLRNQPKIAELAAVYDNLTGWNLVMGEGALTVNENGFLPSLHLQRVNIAEIADSVAALNDLVVSEGGMFCYVQIPSNVCKYEEAPIGTFVDYANENADHLLERLNGLGVLCLDLREELHASGMDHREAFYRTDCHWKVPTAFWAAGVITDYLTQNGEISFDPRKYGTSLYQSVYYENNFLGGNGRAVTLKKAEPEDFEMLLPDYETSFTMEIPSRQMELTGDFEEVFIFDAPLTSHDYYGEDPYDSFRTRNYPLIRIHNQDSENNQGKRLLIIRDSFSAPLIPYLAADIEYVDCLYLQSFNGSVREYIRQTHPDLVLVAYYPPNIQDIDWNGTSSTFDFR